MLKNINKLEFIYVKLCIYLKILKDKTIKEILQLRKLVDQCRHIFKKLKFHKIKKFQMIKFLKEIAILNLNNKILLQKNFNSSTKR
jgi:hypothetical protein